MDSLQEQGWLFEFDQDATRQYYSSHRDTCTCAYCRNFRAGIEEMPSAVREFLAGFGIDVNNPIEQMSAVSDKANSLVEQDAFYVVKGLASSNEGYELDFGPVQISVHTDGYGIPNHEMEEPCFVLSIHNMWFHWVVDEDIDECYSDIEGYETKGLLKKLRGLLIKSK